MTRIHLLILLVAPMAASALFLDKLIGPSPALSSVCAGTCMLCTTCWLGGGRVTGRCGGIYACCQQPKSYAQAEARKISYWPMDDLDHNKLDRHQDVQYGPVLNDRRCGLPVIARRRVVGGSEAGFGRFPWQALIRIGMSRCGGALVNQRHVITAGHCVHMAVRRLSTVRVYLGEYTLHNTIEPLPRQEFSVDKIHKHPYYQFTPQADRYDVAVLRLNPPVRYAPHISPVCLPLKGQIFAEGTTATVAGWGAMKADSLERPLDLQAANVDVVNSTRCELWHEQNKIKGDSGGPLMTQVLDPEEGVRRWTLIGLVSAGYSCAKPGQPGIYHKVSRTADWISYVSQLRIL